MTQQVKKLSTVTVFFRDGFYDNVIFDNVIGYQIGGSAIAVALETGVTKIYPMDIIFSVEHIAPEQEDQAAE